MKLIAEGIETEEELATLINLGVYGGQGYFIKKPHINMDGIPKNVIDKILKYDKLKNIKYKNSKVGFIGEIARIDSPYKDDTKCIEIKNLFDKTDTTGACIVDKNNYPIGIIMKHYIDSFFSKPCGNAIYQKELAKNIMDKKPLVVDYYSGILDVSNIEMSRKTENLYDYVIVTKESKYYGVVTIRSLLHYTTMVESDYARQLNPLTGLPGNSLIDQVLYDICKSNNKYTILYFDLDNFKIYNDNYGFEQGDKIIKYTSNLIKYQANSIFPFDGFLGHIGGDDFIYIIEEHLKESYNLGENILEEFDKNIKSFFSIDDVKMGYMEGLDRNFNKAKVPITSLSIAGIYGSFNKVEDIGTMVSNIKKRVKKIKGSYYSIDKINN